MYARSVITIQQESRNIELKAICVGKVLDPFRPSILTFLGDNVCASRTKSHEVPVAVWVGIRDQRHDVYT